MKQVMSGLVFACIAGFVLTSVNGQLSQSSPIGNCDQYRDSRGQYHITEDDNSMYCFHLHLYQSALDFAHPEAPRIYIQELLKNALSRCINPRPRKVTPAPSQPQPAKPIIPKKVCRTRKCRRARYSKRVKRAALRPTSNRGRRFRKRTKRVARKGNKNRKPHGKESKCNWVRKEVRMLSRSEWIRFAKRLNILKRPIVIPGEGSFIPYDLISNVHSHGPNLDAAYGGPNFLGWNRIYLLILETALGIPVPYWDNRMDYDMDEPTHSILWTDEFFGPGFGIVDSGPFKGWTTADNLSLRRDIGRKGSLISACMVEKILRYKSHDPIVEPTTRSISLEEYQNGPHRWVGEQMSILQSASQDPIFFLHRSFVDYIWYQFRNKLRSAGDVNPSLDYPDKGPPSHRRGETMIPFGNLRNIIGYGDFIERLTQYEDSPTCSACSSSEYLECDTQINRCKSKAKTVDMAAGQMGFQQPRQRMTPALRGKKFRSAETDPRTRGNLF
ncbi:tyrosinase-like protein 2 [Pecten maximus]|uniref:tyrosinase-like protein 2 n=1 Tax=Pecten maximus TaxID=6579 RepID=UPI001458BA40|nr:tyrosinase-like protein 2 [Pecten maximus]